MKSFLVSISWGLTLIAPFAFAAEPMNLSIYYTAYPGPQPEEPGFNVRTAKEYVPLLQGPRGDGTLGYPVTSFACVNAPTSAPYATTFLGLLAYPLLSSIAGAEPLIASPAMEGARRTASVTYSELTGYCGSTFPGQPPGRNWTLSESYAIGAPVRRRTFDGASFDASPLIVKREGEPWLTLYWGYRMGLVESRFDWNSSSLSKVPTMADYPLAPETNVLYEFQLTTLPRPYVEGIVTEYNNTANFPNSPGGQFFYASTDSDRALLDAKIPGQWNRTGREFYQGGFVSVCRFYGSVSPGPNSHFFTADDSDCNLLKALQQSPTPTDRQQWNFEGMSFRASTPIPASGSEAAKCPVASIPLYRAYNAAYSASGKKNYDSNHRFSTERADIEAMVRLGWVDEGMVMCVPQ